MKEVKGVASMNISALKVQCMCGISIIYHLEFTYKRRSYMYMYMQTNTPDSGHY